MSQLAAEKLCRHFQAAMADNSIGGSTVLRDLSDDAYDCVGLSDVQDAVTYALAALLVKYADLWHEGPVLIAEPRRLMAAGATHLSDAVDFIVTGGTPEEAIRIITALGQLLPRFLFA
jgi:hypothetical protein